MGITVRLHAGDACQNWELGDKKKYRPEAVLKNRSGDARVPGIEGSPWELGQVLYREGVELML